MPFNLTVPRVHAKFEDHQEELCACGSYYYYSLSIVHEEVPLCAKWLKRVLGPAFKFVTNFSGQIQDATHESILVHYQCTNCQFKFPVIYDFDYYGKFMGYGKYRKKIATKQRSNVRHSFQSIFYVFEKMPDHDAYKLKQYNCKHWSMEFFNKITDESLDISNEPHAINGLNLTLADISHETNSMDELDKLDVAILWNGL